MPHHKTRRVLLSRRSPVAVNADMEDGPDPPLFERVWAASSYLRQHIRRDATLDGSSESFEHRKEFVEPFDRHVNPRRAEASRRLLDLKPKKLTTEIIDHPVRERASRARLRCLS